MKSSIRFSPDPKRQNGAICHRIPTQAENWTFEFRMRLGKGSLIFLATEETCPYWAISNDVESWTGFALNVTKTGDTLTSSGIYMTNTQVINMGMCKFQGDEVTLKIEKHGTNISVYQSRDGVDLKYELCNEITVGTCNMLFFSFVATSPDEIGDSEIFHVSVNESAERSELYLQNTSDISRLEIVMQQDTVNSSRPYLGLATAIIGEMERAAYSLSKVDDKNTTLELKALLSEIRERLNQSLTAKDLEKLIHATMAVNLLKVERKIDKRRKAFAEISSELDVLKKSINERLEWLGEYVVDVMTQSKKDAVNTLSIFLNLTNETDVLKEESKSRAKDAKSNFVPPLLCTVAFLEFACYIAFFFVKHRKTFGFKKYD